MTGSRRRCAALLVVLLACVLPAGSAQAAGTENVAEAVIAEDNGQAWDFAWDIDRQRGDALVDHRNVANARASCVRCEATAIAFQIVLVNGNPRQVVPVNVAEAVNTECTECQVVAEARQFVRVIDEPVKFTAGGRAELGDVKRDLAALEAQDLPIDQLHLAVEQQEARVRQVLATELVTTADPDSEPELLKQRSLQAVDLD
jgi:hypothetical protein